MNRRGPMLLIVMGILCSSAIAEEKAPTHLAFWQNLEGRWNYERSPDGGKGMVTWRVTTGGSALRGSYQEDKGGVSTETAGWRPDTKSMVVNGFGSEGNHWHLHLDKVTPLLVEGKSEGVLPNGESVSGEFSGKLVNKDRYEVSINETDKDGTASQVKITFRRIKSALVTCPWEWMLGQWKVERSDGTSADVHWSKPRADADYLIGKWDESDGTKLTELVGWRPDQEVLVANAHGASGQYFGAWFNKVSAKKMSGWIRILSPDGKMTRSRVVLERVNENLVKAKNVDESDGSVVTSTFTRVITAAEEDGPRRRLRSVLERLRGVLRAR